MSLPTLAHPCFLRGLPGELPAAGLVPPSLWISALSVSGSLGPWQARGSSGLGSWEASSLSPFPRVRLRELKGAGTKHPPCGRSVAQGCQASAFAPEELGWVCRDRVDRHRLSTLRSAGGAVGITAGERVRGKSSPRGPLPGPGSATSLFWTFLFFSVK